MSKRDSRFEIIRIISMIFIIMYHYTLYGNWTGSHNSFKIQAFRPWGQVGVYLFVMITGYFLSTRKENLKSIWQRNKTLWLKTLVYSCIILILTLLFNLHGHGLKEYLFAIFPIIFDEYWFITSYIVLIFLLPLLNWMIQTFERKQLLLYIGIILVVADLMPYLQNMNPNAPLGGIFSVGAMMGPYLIAAYIKKYNLKINNLKAALIALIGIFLEYCSVFILVKKDPGRFTGGILPLITATGIFMLFLNLKSFHSSIINWISSGVLASYLITEHPLFRLTFWHRFLNVAKFQNPTWLFVLMGILIAIFVVFICSLIDNLIFKKLFYYVTKIIQRPFGKLGGKSLVKQKNKKKKNNHSITWNDRMNYFLIAFDLFYFSFLVILGITIRLTKTYPQFFNQLPFKLHQNVYLISTYIIIFIFILSFIIGYIAYRILAPWVSSKTTVLIDKTIEKLSQRSKNIIGLVRSWFIFVITFLFLFKYFGNSLFLFSVFAIVGLIIIILFTVKIVGNPYIQLQVFISKQKYTFRYKQLIRNISYFWLACGLSSISLYFVNLFGKNISEFFNQIFKFKYFTKMPDYQQNFIIFVVLFGLILYLLSQLIEAFRRETSITFFDFYFELFSIVFFLIFINNKLLLVKDIAILVGLIWIIYIILNLTRKIIIWINEDASNAVNKLSFLWAVLGALIGYVIKLLLG